MFFKRRRLQALLSLVTIALCVFFLTFEPLGGPNAKPYPEETDPALVFSEGYERLMRDYVYPPEGGLMLQTAVLAARVEAKRRGISPSDLGKTGFKSHNLEQVKSYLEGLAQLNERAYPRAEVYAAAVAGLTSALSDPYTFSMDPVRFSRFNQDLQTRYYGGLGIEIEWSRGGYTVFEVRSNSPAWAADIMAGDVLLAVDGLELAPLGRNPVPLEQVLSMLEGDEGSEVTLQLFRDGSLFSRRLRRELLESRTVYGRLIAGSASSLPSLGWIRVESFADTTGSETASVLSTLQLKGAKVVVLDLRDNLGGYLNSAVEIASLFLPSGSPVVYVQERSHQGVKPAIGVNHSKLPLAVLVNRRTASSAEVLAGALRDWERAVLIGEATFGKGSVQTVYALSGGWGLKLTTAYYLTPKRNRLEGGGLKPDFTLDMPQNKEESDLRGEVARFCQERWIMKTK